MTANATNDRPRGAKLGLVLALTVIVGGCLIFDRVYKGRAPARPDEAPADRTLVLVHGGVLGDGDGGSTPLRRQGNRRRGVPAVDRRSERVVQEPPAPRRHLVVKGDNLYRLGVAYYGTSARWKDIASANGLREPYLIRQGDRLTIP